jgi:hypothetical protein
LRAEVIPSASHRSGEYGDRHQSDSQSVPVLDAPMSRLLGCSESDAAESIFFQLMAGFCAHDDLPVSVLVGQVTVYQPEIGTVKVRR